MQKPNLPATATLAAATTLDIVTSQFAGLPGLREAGGASYLYLPAWLLVFLLISNLRYAPRTVQRWLPLVLAAVCFAAPINNLIHIAQVTL